MDGQVRNNSWPTPALLHVSREGTVMDIFSESSSSHLSPFKSSESSHSGAESETAWSDEPKTTTAFASDRLGRPLRHQIQTISEQGEGSLGSGPAPQKSRKGHKKSHEGCFNCKRRKIKCQETQPACENCMKKNLNCSYPAPRTLKALRGSLINSSSPIASVNLQGTPTTFTLTDMRLFHHFLMNAYPHLPVGNDSAWLSQVPLIAHHNEYLMHAILALSATHLELLTGVSLGSLALHHRLLAVQGSNAALSRRNRTGSDGDSLLGSCYLLTFQSSYMKDGLLDYFTMVRGCSLLSNQFREEKLPMAFFITEKDHFQFMEERLLDLPMISPELGEGAGKSLATIQPLCNLRSQIEFYRLLDDCIEAIKTSSLRAYFKFISIFHGIIQMGNETFQEFMDPSNIVARILISHFFAIKLVVAPIINREWAGRKRYMPLRHLLNQIYQICKDVPARFRKYLDWPLAITDAASDEITGKATLVPRVPILRKTEWVDAPSGDPGWA